MYNFLKNFVHIFLLIDRKHSTRIIIIIFIIIIN